MAYHSHHRRHHKLKHGEKIILFIVLPIAVVVALLISITIKSLPRIYWNFVNNFRIDETISTAIKKGSAVRRETYLRQKYESKWRQDSLDVWEEHYKTILENKENREIDEIQRQLKNQPIPRK